MRNIRHHTLIVTVHDVKLAEKLRSEIIELYRKNMEVKNGFQLISAIVPSLINNFFTFYITPDGSKEGYDLSEDGDHLRKKVVELLKGYSTADGSYPVNFVEVSYGDDHEPPEIVTYL